MGYIDMHLSHVAQHTGFGYIGDIDIAVIEVEGYGRHTPHLLPEALAWHQRFIETGSIRT